MESSREVKGPAWLEDWLPKVSAAIPASVRILRGRAKMTLDAAYTSLNILILKLIKRWRRCGPPAHVKEWPPYLAKSAYRLHIQKPRKDAKFLEFRTPVPTVHSAALDTPDDQAHPEETLITREQFGRAAVYILGLSRSQMKVVVLWAMGYPDSDIAFVLNVSESRIRSLRSQGFRRLRSKMLQGSDDSGGQNASEIA